MVEGLDPSCSRPLALRWAAVSRVDAAGAVLAARVANVVCVVEVAWDCLGGAVVDAGVAVEEKVLGSVAFGAIVGRVLAVHTDICVARTTYKLAGG